MRKKSRRKSYQSNKHQTTFPLFRSCLMLWKFSWDAFCVFFGGFNNDVHQKTVKTRNLQLLNIKNCNILKKFWFIINFWSKFLENTVNFHSFMTSLMIAPTINYLNSQVSKPFKCHWNWESPVNNWKKNDIIAQKCKKTSRNCKTKRKSEKKKNSWIQFHSIHKLFYGL